MVKHACAVQSHAMQRFETIPGLTHSDSEPQERHSRQAIPSSSFRSGLRVDDVPGQGRKHMLRKIHTFDSDECEAAIERLRLERVQPEVVAISRCLGLGAII
ncbi:MAG: hypothetical protein AW09_003287 [Candidatus Accumulibacter phosphatis]|uniref:Uncharacterized protein n=1 Tax=Candidatus Accumulibacter phosphatis TaxID=327160 RepID=A0A080LT24_9PROT|nr:hypothetical protein [Accumulibacter sp.]KFB71576.1 MAG: hypothetical protein AW09_003287 [Candidatus Accumulibacter phosphatis]HRF11730.1 hypothetical protein [Candidatus Accumulibacter phosphatis]